MYFGVYEKSYSVLNGGEDASEKPKTLWKTSIAGGLAGSFSWFLAYPLDTFKTTLFAEDYKNRRFNGFLDVAVKTTKNRGIKGIYSGVLVTSVRGFPVCGGIFTAYEMTKNGLVKFASSSQSTNL